MILYLMPMYAIHKLPALEPYRGKLSNVFVTAAGRRPAASSTAWRPYATPPHDDAAGLGSRPAAVRAARTAASARAGAVPRGHGDAGRDRRAAAGSLHTHRTVQPR
ncbi:hypothetical protein QJS66_13685 [Kocuria rhizophila]|nr:hypothetical protein QJS66_13685 [Kocuria rhizophila]